MIDEGMNSTAPAFRRDLIVSPLKGPEGMRFVVKDPVTQGFFHFREAEHFIARQCDGRTSIECLRQKAEKEFGATLPLETLTVFIAKLRQNGLLESSRPRTPKVRRRFQGTLLYFRFKLFDPNELFTRLERKIRFFFTASFVAISALIILLAIATTAAHADELVQHLARLYRFAEIPVLLLTIFLVVGAHEFAHGLTCKHFGGEVHEIGGMFIYFQPALYCNVSDAWLFPEKSKRLWVAFAGPYFELFIWGIATLLWRLTDVQTWINHVAFVVMASSGVKTLINFNPLVKLDGYYLLSDYLEIPNLRKRSFVYIGNLARRALGGVIRAGKSVTPRERRIFLVYGLTATVSSFALLLFFSFQAGSLLIAQHQPLSFSVLVGLFGLKFQQRVRRLMSKSGTFDDGDESEAREKQESHKTLKGADMKTTSSTKEQQVQKGISMPGEKSRNGFVQRMAGTIAGWYRIPIESASALPASKSHPRPTPAESQAHNGSRPKHGKNAKHTRKLPTQESKRPESDHLPDANPLGEKRNKAKGVHGASAAKGEKQNSWWKRWFSRGPKAVNTSAKNDPVKSHGASVDLGNGDRDRAKSGRGETCYVRMVSMDSSLGSKTPSNGRALSFPRVEVQTSRQTASSSTASSGATPQIDHANLLPSTTDKTRGRFLGRFARKLGWKARIIPEPKLKARVETVKPSAPPEDPAKLAPAPEPKKRSRLQTTLGKVSFRGLKWGVAVITAAAVMLFVQMELRIGGEFDALPVPHADARTRIEGTVAEVLVDEGQPVKVGDLLARLSDLEIKAELAKTIALKEETHAKLKMLEAGPTVEETDLARAAVKKAEDTLRYAQGRVKRDKGLAEQDFVSRKDYEDVEELATNAQNVLTDAKSRLTLLLRGPRREEIDAMRAELARWDAQKIYLEEELQLLEIRSLASGVVATPSRQLRELKHQLVKKGEPIARVHQLNVLSAEIIIPEKEIADVKPGQKVILKARAYPGRPFYGIVKNIGVTTQRSPEEAAAAPNPSLSGRTVLVTTEIDNSSLLLKPGMTGQAKIYCGKQRLIELASRRLSRTVKVEFWSWW
jgi:multidrug resistance efflux pump